MTGEQWQAAWIICETAADMDPAAREEYIRGVTVDPDVERQVLEVLEELSLDPVFPSTPDPRCGDSIGRYIVQERIGQGGMGQVYSARDTELDREVAIKFLPADLPLETAAAQIIREGRSASSLNHPNIVTVHEIMQTERRLAIVMELVEGRSLRTMRKARPLSKRETMRIGREIASALSAAHEKGIIHRDIKPENVMVRTDGLVKVLDFGLAQKIREGTMSGKSAHLPVGTVRYMSPEQMRGEEVTGASDVYALGVVLEELGSWRHSLFVQMRNPIPEQRPAASAVVRHLERLERSPNYLVIAAGILLAVLVAASWGIQFWRKTHQIPELRFDQITKLATGHDITVAGLSPDGKLLAYASIEGGLFVRNNRTAGVQELDPPDGLSISQLFFPADSGLLAIGANEGSYEAWRIPLDGSAAVRLRTGTRLVALSHDNKRLAWLNADGEVWTGPLDGKESSLLYKWKPGERIATILWSASDQRLWFHTLGRCRDTATPKDAFVSPDNCDSSDLTLFDPATGALALKLENLRFTSALVRTNGEFLFLRQDSDRSRTAFNLWSLHTDPQTDAIKDKPKQLTHLSNVVLSQLTASSDGRTLSVVRTDCPMLMYVAGLKTGPDAALLNIRRLTLEQTNAFPHAWSPDGQSLILESSKNGRLELFQQKLTRREPQLLATTSGDLYMPALTPDGKWVLAMYRPTPGTGKPDDLTRHRLMRVPSSGGEPVEVPIGGPLDEFRCSLPGHGKICVLRTTERNEQRFFVLDPIKGKGQELGRMALAVTWLGGWSLSPDGTTAFIPDHRRAGWFSEIRLDPSPSRRSQRMRRIEGLANALDSISRLPSGTGWLGTSGVADPYQMMEARSRTENLYYFDANLKPYALFKSYAGTYGVASPDEKRLAFVGAELTANVWTFER